LGPPWAGDQSAYYLCTNRNKRSITIDRVLADPQVLAREMVLEMEHPSTGKYKVVGSPMKLSETPVQYRFPPPRLGEHTEEVLRVILGYEQAQISRLEEQKVI